MFTLQFSANDFNLKTVVLVAYKTKLMQGTQKHTPFRPVDPGAEDTSGQGHILLQIGGLSVTEQNTSGRENIDHAHFVGVLFP